MFILNNAIKLIQIGVGNFLSEDKRRQLSALRNIISGDGIHSKQSSSKSSACCDAAYKANQDKTTLMLFCYRNVFEQLKANHQNGAEEMLLRGWRDTL